MNIILFTLIFEPDTCAGSYIFSDFATELIKRGHKVTVITTTPHYDEKNAEQKKKTLISGEKKYYYKSNFNGAEVYHIDVGTKKGNFLNRIKTFFLFQTKAVKIVKKMRIPCDVIYSQTPPMTIGGFANKIAKFKRAKSVLIVQDLWLDAVYNKGKINKFLYKILSFFERRDLKRTTYITTLSSEMKNVLVQKTKNKKEVFIIPNFVNDNIYYPINNISKKDLGFNENKFTVSYVGNIGKAQNLMPLIYLAENNHDVEVIVAGNGVDEAKYKNIVEEKGLQNFKFLGYVSREKSASINAVSDICCIMLGEHVVSTSFPSKLYTIMGMGKPVLVSSSKHSSVAKFVLEENIGVHCDVKEKQSIINEVEKCIKNREKISDMGHKALLLCKEKYTSSVVCDEYLSLVKGEKNE